MTVLPRGLHDAHGAVWHEDDLNPRNYGNPAAEYAAALERAIIVERRDRRVLRSTGRDPVKMLQGLITNDVAAAANGQRVYAAVLTPKGRMVADVDVIADGADLLIGVHAVAEPLLRAHLRKYVPPLFARYDETDLCVLAVHGPAAAAALEAVLGTPIPSIGGSVARMEFDGSQVIVSATSSLGVPGWELWVPVSAGERLWREVTARGAVPAGESTVDVLRIEAGTPAWGRELDDSTIPLEAGLRDRAISETKGCYTGQEVIIRILHRGHVNWHLRRLHLGDSGTPAQGTLLANEEGKTIGRVTSAAWSPKYGEVLGMGYIRREVAPGSTVWMNGGATVRVEELP